MTSYCDNETKKHQFIVWFHHGICSHHELPRIQISAEWFEQWHGPSQQLRVWLATQTTVTRTPSGQGLPDSRSGWCELGENMTGSSYWAWALAVWVIWAWVREPECTIQLALYICMYTTWLANDSRVAATAAAIAGPGTVILMIGANLARAARARSRQTWSSGCQPECRRLWDSNSLSHWWPAVET